MRWFVAFFTSTLLVGVVGGAFWVRSTDIPEVSVLTDAMVWLIPGEAVPVVERLQIPLALAAFVAFRVMFQWALAYIASATESSPRGRPGRRATVGSVCYHLLGNPGRWWLSGFVMLMLIVSVPTGLYVRYFSSDPLPHVALTITLLFTATLIGAAAVPDRAQPLLPGDDADVTPAASLYQEDRGPASVTG